MSTELTVLTNTMSMWEDEERLQEIKAIFAPKLNTNEFKAFIGMGKANDLNPFLREIWAVKYDEKSPAQIFIGRDGYRKSASRNPEYDYHQVDSVYTNDIFQVVNGEVRHSYSGVNRGDLLGAYCNVHKHGATRPIYVFVPLKDYDKGQSCWKNMKDTMIKKVAEAQALRMAFPEQYAGSYSEFEEPLVIGGQQYIPKQSQSSRMNALLNKKGFKNAKKPIDLQVNSNNANPIPHDEDGILLDENSISSIQTGKREASSTMAENGESENSVNDSQDEFMPCSQEQLESINFLIHEKNVDKTGQLKCLDHFNVTSFAELNYSQAEKVIKKLNKMESQQ